MERSMSHNRPRHEEGKALTGSSQSGVKDANSDGRDRKWYQKPDWWIVVLTAALAAFALGSFVTLLVQVSDARSASTKDQSPYVWVEPQPPTLKAASRSVGMFTMRITVAHLH